MLLFIFYYLKHSKQNINRVEEKRIEEDMLLYTIRYDYVDLKVMLDLSRDGEHLKSNGLFMAHIKAQVARRISFQ